MRKIVPSAPLSLSVLLGLWPLSSGCSGSEEYHFDINDPVETTHLFSETYCAHVEECGPPEGWEYEPCMELLDIDEAGEEQLRENIESVVALYSPEAAQECLDALDAHECPINPQMYTEPTLGFDLDLGDACDSVIIYRACGVDGCDPE